MATAPVPPSAKEKTNHIRLSRLLIDIGRRVLKDVFDSFHPPSGLHGVLNSTGPVQSKLRSLKSRKVIYAQQWDLLYPSSGTVDSKNFDITLLFLLLRNICGLRPPVTRWDAAPSPADLSKEADLVRIKRCRNELHAHSAKMALTDDEFDSNWDEIEGALNRLVRSKYKTQIDHLKFASIDHEKDNCFYVLLQSWKEDQDVKRKIDKTFALEIKKVLAKLDDIAENRGSKEVVEELRQSVQTILTKMTEIATEKKDSVADQEVLQQIQKLHEKLDEVAEKKGPRHNEIIQHLQKLTIHTAEMLDEITAEKNSAPLRHGSRLNFDPQRC